MKKYTYLSIAAGLALLTGCSTACQQFRQGELRDLIGHPQSEVVQLLGQPTKNIVDGNTRYLVYTTTYENYTPPESTTYMNPGSLPSNVAGNIGHYSPETCVTTFEIRQSIIQNVHSCGRCM